MLDCCVLLVVTVAYTSLVSTLIILDLSVQCSFHLTTVPIFLFLTGLWWLPFNVSFLCEFFQDCPSVSSIHVFRGLHTSAHYSVSNRCPLKFTVHERIEQIPRTTEKYCRKFCWPLILKTLSFFSSYRFLRLSHIFENLQEHFFGKNCYFIQDTCKCVA